MRQPVRARVQLAVSELPGFEDQGGCFGRPFYLVFKQFLQAFVGDALLRVIEVQYHRAQFFRSQERQFGKKLARVFHHRFEQHLVMPQHPLDSRFIEQICVVLHPSGKAFRAFGEVQRKVELRSGGRRR